jgi:hypothetical protein
MAEYRHPKHPFGSNPYLVASALTAVAATTDISLNAQLGRNARKLTLINDTGTIVAEATFQLSYDGTTFSAALPIQGDETFVFEDQDIHTLRLNATADWSYRIIAH